MSNRQIDSCKYVLCLLFFIFVWLYWEQFVGIYKFWPVKSQKSQCSQRGSVHFAALFILKFTEDLQRLVAHAWCFLPRMLFTSELSLIRWACLSWLTAISKLIWWRVKYVVWIIVFRMSGGFCVFRRLFIAFNPTFRYASLTNATLCPVGHSSFTHWACGNCVIVNFSFSLRMKLKILIRRDFAYSFTIKQSDKTVKATFRLHLSPYQAMKIRTDELKHSMKIKHEVMLFTLATQSSKKLTSSGVLLSIEWRLELLNETHFIQKTIKLSLAILKNRE